MNIEQLKNDFKAGKISKPEYINLMHRQHRMLFDYADFISATDIKRIEIVDGSVIMTSRAAGISIVCDKDDQRIAPIEILNFDNYEKDDFDMIITLIDKEFTVLDIGGNIGWYAINIAKLKKSAKIHSFEPIPKTYDYLTRNLVLNNVKNVYAYNFGFSSKEQDLSF